MTALLVALAKLTELTLRNIRIDLTAETRSALDHSVCGFACASVRLVTLTNVTFQQQEPVDDADFEDDDDNHQQQDYHMRNVRQLGSLLVSTFPSMQRICLEQNLVSAQGLPPTLPMLNLAREWLQARKVNIDGFAPELLLPRNKVWLKYTGHFRAEDFSDYSDEEEGDDSDEDDSDEEDDDSDEEEEDSDEEDESESDEEEDEDYEEDDD